MRFGLRRLKLELGFYRYKNFVVELISLNWSILIMGVEDSFSGLLLEIETAIVSVVHQYDNLVDRHILFALEDLYKFWLSIGA